MSVSNPPFSLLLAISALFVVSVGKVRGKDAAPPTTAPKGINKLVEQLNSSRFALRRQAYRQLQTTGEPALNTLQNAAANHSSADVRRLAAQLAAEIGQRVEASRLMAANRVRLAYQNVPLLEVLSDLKKRFDCNLILKDADQSVASRRVTLKAENATFWETFDQFCLQSGLAPTAMRNDVRVAGFYMAKKPTASLLRGGEKSSDPITLQKGLEAALATQYVGPFRLRVIPFVKAIGPGDSYKGLCFAPPSLGLWPQDSEIVLSLELAAQPGLGIGSIGLAINKAVDDQGQSLQPLTNLTKGQDGPTDTDVAALEAMRQMFQGRGTVLLGETFPDDRCRAVTLEFSKAASPSRVLKELKGSLRVVAWSPHAKSVCVSDVFKAEGRALKGEYGVVIKILSASREADGRVCVHFELAMSKSLTGAAPWDASQFVLPYLQGPLGRLTLEDDQGGVKPDLLQTQLKSRKDQIIWSIQATFRPFANRRPQQLVFTVRRCISVDVPFAFSNLSLKGTDAAMLRFHGPRKRLK